MFIHHPPEVYDCVGHGHLGDDVSVPTPMALSHDTHNIVKLLIGSESCAAAASNQGQICSLCIVPVQVS